MDLKTEARNILSRLPAGTMKTAAREAGLVAAAPTEEQIARLRAVAARIIEERGDRSAANRRQAERDAYWRKRAGYIRGDGEDFVARTGDFAPDGPNSEGLERS